MSISSSIQSGEGVLCTPYTVKVHEINKDDMMIAHAGVYTRLEKYRILLPSQGFTDPVHLHRTHPARIAAVGEHELVVHDSLDFLAKQNT